MNNKPLVTVIIPTYNRANKLGIALDSVYNQTYKPIQLVVIDDGSSDHTSTMMKDHPKAEYIIQKHAGQAAARNNGLRHAKGTIIASLDSDDIWDPYFLERSVNKLEDEQLDFVFANWVQESPDGQDWDFLSGDPYLTPYFKKIKNQWVTLSYTELRSIYIEACPSPSSAVVLRKSSIVSGWDERIHVGDDWCMYLDIILSKECNVAFTLERLWTKRIDEINIYDGRKRHEVLKFLYIEDTHTIIKKYKHLLTPMEIVLLERRYIASSVELAKHELIREYNIGESMKLIRNAFKIDVLFTLKMVPNIILNGFRHKFGKTPNRNVIKT